MNELLWKKFHPLSDKNAFICLVDHMGDDSSIVQAARVSYGKDEQEGHELYQTGDSCPDVILDDNGEVVLGMCKKCGKAEIELSEPCRKPFGKNDRQLIRYLMNHSHTTPFEMVEIKFMVQVPMDCWRQWIRHRTASVNEYSTRYTEALDACQTTPEDGWRLQATDNKQGSSGFLNDELGNLLTVEQALDLIQFHTDYLSFHKAGAVLSKEESLFHKAARKLYELRLALGIAKEQARKDLPLSTYTRAYWKCDLHNIFNFLRLRMDSHAQLEIRSFANCMFEIVKQLCPVACEAFEDYVLHTRRFSRMEMEVILKSLSEFHSFGDKPDNMTDREWKEFLGKLS